MSAADSFLCYIWTMLRGGIIALFVAVPVAFCGGERDLLVDIAMRFPGHCEGVVSWSVEGGVASCSATVRTTFPSPRFRDERTWACQCSCLVRVTAPEMLQRVDSLNAMQWWKIESCKPDPASFLGDDVHRVHIRGNGRDRVLRVNTSCLSDRSSAQYKLFKCAMVPLEDVLAALAAGTLQATVELKHSLQTFKAPDPR